MKAALPLRIAIACLLVSLPSQARADSVPGSHVPSTLCSMDGRLVSMDEEASCWREAYAAAEETAEAAAAVTAVAFAAATVVNLPNPFSVVGLAWALRCMQTEMQESKAALDILNRCLSKK